MDPRGVAQLLREQTGELGELSCRLSRGGGHRSATHWYLMSWFIFSPKMELESRFGWT